MPAGVEQLSFSFTTVIEIMSLVVAGASAWFYLRSQFHHNEQSIEQVKTDLVAHGELSQRSIVTLGEKIDDLATKVGDQSNAIVRIEARGEILEGQVLALRGNHAL